MRCIKEKIYNYFRKNNKRKVFLTVLYVIVVTLVLCFIILYDFDKNDEIQVKKIDIDNDGVKEEVTTLNSPGRHIQYIKESDGTLYKTEYDYEGNVTNQWKLVPVDGEVNTYVYCIWDENSCQWLQDQNQDGIPDDKNS